MCECVCLVCYLPHYVSSTSLAVVLVFGAKTGTGAGARARTGAGAGAAGGPGVCVSGRA